MLPSMNASTTSLPLAEPVTEPTPETSAQPGHIPGNKGIWVGITCEFVEFLVLFIVYFVSRAHFPEAFQEGSARLSQFAGTAITLLMISSSFCLACSVAFCSSSIYCFSRYFLL